MQRGGVHRPDHPAGVRHHLGLPDAGPRRHHQDRHQRGLQGAGGLPGKSLLSLLADQKIFLPSACGGGGTCAMCKCQVLSGGGNILPTETGHINKQAAKQGQRLACQLKVKNDLKIHVPDEVLEIKKFEGTVRSNRNVATFIKEFIVDLPPGVDLHFKAGGYIQIDIPTYDIKFKDFDIDAKYRDAWDKFKLWDLTCKERGSLLPRLLHGQPPGGRQLRDAERAHRHPAPERARRKPGIASSYIYSLKPGDKVWISGPFGEFFAKETKREMVYIGGGAGMAPLRSHLFDLFHTRKTDRKVSSGTAPARCARCSTRGLPRDREEVPQLQVQRGPQRTPGRGQLDRLQGLHPHRGARAVPQEASRPHRDRVLPVRPAAHDRGRQQDALRPRRRKRDDRVR
jgi:ferredoxin